MNSSAINSILAFNQSSSGTSLQLSSVNLQCNSPDFEFTFQFAVYTINFVMGSPANIMVLWLVASKEIDSSTSDGFFVSLAIVDALFCLIIIFDYFVYYFYKQIDEYLMHFTYGMKEASTVFLTCICLDRYMAVVHPIVFSSVKDNKIRVAISMLVWQFIIAYCFIRVWMGYDLDMFFTGMIMTITIIMVFCNISIMRSLRKSVLGKEKISPMKKKAQRTVQSTLAIIVFLYLPIAVTSPLVYITAYKATCAIKSFTLIIMDFSSSIEPLLCISRLKQLRCLNNLPCICCRSPSSEPHNSTCVKLVPWRAKRLQVFLQQKPSPGDFTDYLTFKESEGT